MDFHTVIPEGTLRSLKITFFEDVETLKQIWCESAMQKQKPIPNGPVEVALVDLESGKENEDYDWMLSTPRGLNISVKFLCDPPCLGNERN